MRPLASNDGIHFEKRLGPKEADLTETNDCGLRFGGMLMRMINPRSVVPVRNFEIMLAAREEALS
jgi:hypothetical protein